MGRTPQPVALKLLKGRADGRDSGGRPVALAPAFRRIAPKPPTWLSREAAAEWRRVVPGLQRLDLLKEEDRAMLAAYCETWSTFVQATRTVNREGITDTVTTMSASGSETTRTVQHPAVAIARSAGRELRAMAVQFGLTPSSEQALARGADDGEDDNPFA
ncbi:MULTISPECIES: phage terminase small subunit P27 family [Streptomyces]|uniref:Phage terminase small subunit P27 family n=1 Tax=Streptomyces europaeiscabiei TaxID=146819 RepID=A0ABU4NQG9_9ACTN|nr:MULTISPECIES: phage terminase small subunit P27 family [Streptomyces]MBP5922170.1 phage terminase small subunit P27 family [Streptomyces sp. LBUM 1483]MDX3555197.1 phage terminase small subunit P27 family [Streptomyces europaeiscabiei]MDX3705211.1 phage terminase small subunit P27 family [Streptomyces europaeiscabiei]MDX3864378.1 phage terminase small subunit P27 family [Streptomyces europaeiscabiei]MDX3871540.1 phage terminase small subunit P27 family [Streptomyces europaeiscabiei]